MCEKFIFILNPVAGKGKASALKKTIYNYMERGGYDYEIIITKEAGSPGFEAQKALERIDKGKKVRIYSCGGDGTLNEVINGIQNFENVILGSVPLGSGNDFLRMFGKPAEFLQLDRLIKGKIKKVDLMEFETLLQGKKRTARCVNMFNIGFDCNVVKEKENTERYPFIEGSLAYFSAIIKCLVKKKTSKLIIKLNGEEVFRDVFLLCSVANGAYCGGGIKALPNASVMDGYIDLSIIRNLSRRRFLSLLPKYMKGTHLGIKKAEETFFYKQGSSVEIISEHGVFDICVDGNIEKCEKVKIYLLKNKLNFIV